MAQQDNQHGRSQAMDAFEQRLRALYDTHADGEDDDSPFSAADFFASAPAAPAAAEPSAVPAVEETPSVPNVEDDLFPAEDVLDFSEADAAFLEDGTLPLTGPAPAPARPAARTAAARPAPKAAPARKSVSGPRPAAPRKKSPLREVSSAGEVVEAASAASSEPLDEETEIARLTEALPSRKRPQPRPAQEAVRRKAPKAPSYEEEQPVRQKAGFGKVLLRILAVVLATALILSCGVFALVSLVINGPSPDAGKILVSSLNETSALKFVPYWFLEDDEVEAILHPPVEEVAPDTYRELSFAAAAASGEETASGEEPLVHVTEPTDGEVIKLIDISGATYKGKMLIISDPAKVVVGTLERYGGVGWYLTEFVENYGAIAGTNAGGFYDPDGQGSGGIPDGLVIRDGAIAFGDQYSYYYNVIGFDADHILHVGNMKGQEALDLGLQSAVSFTPGPVLIKDGVRQSGWNSSLNPRTCIGQTADGTVLLAVIEGRHLDSMGASFDDLADLMESYGVVNAANLDGGSSSSMIYNGEQITKGSSIVGSRQMATAILVLP